ncbi:hypothetical protein KKF64_02410, partial [Patescibacteria group bacterium]|nr:hypothetical protein [Patescibacteria group bacterium]
MISDPRDILLFVIAFLNIVLGFLVLIRKRRSWVNIFFSLLAFSIVLWSIGLSCFRNATDFDSAILWARLYYLAAAIIAYSFLMFGLMFPYAKIKFRWWKHILILIPFIASCILVFTKYHVEAIFIQPWGKDVILGWGYVAYTMYMVMYMGAAFVSMWKKGRESVGIRKMQIRYVLLGTLIATIGGSIFNLFYPLVGNYQFIWLGPLFTFLLVVFIAYAIIRYRLMNIRLILSRIMRYIFTFATTFVIVDITLYFFGAFELNLTNTKSVVISSLFAVFIIILHDPLQRFFGKITANIFFRGSSDYQKLLQEIGHIIVEEVSQDGLVSSVSKNLRDQLKVQHAHIWILDEEKGVFTVRNSNLPKIGTNSPLVSLLEHSRDSLVTEEVELAQNQVPDKKEYIRLDALVKELRRCNIALARRVMLDGKLIAISTLGPKRSKDIFDEELIKIFDVIAPQIATALSRTKLYDEAQQFTVKLKKEVDEATSDLLKANVRLKQLDQSKSEFLSIAAHQLRTPITGIKGYISMFLEGDFGKISDPQRIELEKIYRSSDRLTRLIDVFLNVSRIETGRLDLKKENFSLVGIIEEVVGDLGQQAKKKNLEITVQKPDKEMLEVCADKDKIHDVVMNLIDNSIKYTEKGWVNIRVSRSKSLVTLEVKDSGIGIDPNEIVKLFQKFSRSEAVTRIHTGGSGLGLFIAKKIIEAHGGRIWAESEGKDKGSMFTFT